MKRSIRFVCNPYEIVSVNTFSKSDPGCCCHKQVIKVISEGPWFVGLMKCFNNVYMYVFNVCMSAI